MQKILKSLSDFHDSQVQKLSTQIISHSETISALKEEIQSLKEEKHSQKLIVSELLDKVKEFESYKNLYFQSLDKLKDVQSNFNAKQNSWNNFKERIKQKILKKKSEPLQALNSQDLESEDNKTSLGNSEAPDMAQECVVTDRYKVSKLAKGNRDLSVAESMPWAQKRKDKESRPDYAYTEVVRKKDERKRMDASDCPCCKDFYDACGLPKIVEHEGRQVDRIKLVSRHRFVHKDPETPEGYWDLDYNALYSTDEENDTREGKRKRLEALEAQKKSKIV